MENYLKKAIKKPEFPENINLGKALELQRVLLGKEKQEVAVAAGISLSTYNNIEIGVTKSPTMRTLKSLSEILDLDVMYLVSLIGSDGRR